MPAADRVAAVSDLLHMPLAVAYIVVALAIEVGPRPTERWRLWQGVALAAAVFVIDLDLGYWVSAAVWGWLLVLHCDELGKAYRPELYRGAGRLRA